MNTKDTHRGRRPTPRSIGVQLLILAFLMKFATWVIQPMTADAGKHQSGLEAGLYNLSDVVLGTGVDVFSIILIAAAGFCIAMGGGSVKHHEPISDTTDRTRAQPRVTLTEEAQLAGKRFDALAAQFRSIPESMVSPEASIEFERINSSHMPDLQTAHREARATVTAKSNKSGELDADYALSLSRISDALEGLIEGCETLGRERLEVQGRFIKARHP